MTNKKTYILERQSFRMKQPHNQEAKEIDQAQGYKYLGVLEADEMKDRTLFMHVIQTGQIYFVI